jgi:hypothetical protein
VHAALALTELVVNNDSVKTAVAPQVGKVIQGMLLSLPELAPPPIPSVIDLLKLSDETDLEILNHSMEVMVDCFQTELLPVATQLAARLVRSLFVLNIARFA